MRSGAWRDARAAFDVSGSNDKIAVTDIMAVKQMAPHLVDGFQRGLPRVFVQVREKVRKGDSLAEVSSPDVGIARDEVRKREADREIEKKAADWAVTIADNVAALLEVLAARPPLETVEQQFKGRVLGAYREKILGAYSRLVFV